MTNDPLPEQLRELNWRRRLSALEEAELRAWLSAHPEAQAEWEEDLRLSEALTRLPDVPVASNFTARVLDEVQLEAAREAALGRNRAPSWAWLRRLGWAPRVAFVVVVVSSGGLFYRHEVRMASRREMAKSVEVASSGVASFPAVVSSVAPMPAAELLQDFDAIRALNRTPAADEQLLTLFQ